MQPDGLALAPGRHFDRFWLFPISLALLGGALLAYFVIAPYGLELSRGYTSETSYSAESRFRETPSGEWQNIQLVAWRRDQALVNTGKVLVIQSDLHWITGNDQLLFENSGLYGVDRLSRKNVAEYGDQPREGQFLFPIHLQKAVYQYWDSMFIGLREASYDHTETLDGLELYVFRLHAEGMDETAGYSYLPDVPERYQTHTDGQGRLWIEPLSGTVVDYEEQGASYFVDAASGVRIANFFEWSDRYTPQTKAAQLAQARQRRLRIQAFETWLPGGLLALGLLLLALDLKHRLDSKRRTA